MTQNTYHENWLTWTIEHNGMPQDQTKSYTVSDSNCPSIQSWITQSKIMHAIFGR